MKGVNLMPNQRREMGFSVFSDEYYMAEALKEAELAYREDEVPVGAVVVIDRQIIARGHNRVEQMRDPSAHAEILALTAATDNLGSKYLDECSLYVTLEPCAMCAGSMAWAQLNKLVFGAGDEKRGFRIYQPSLLHPQTKIEFGILEDESASLLKRFFKAKR